MSAIELPPLPEPAGEVHVPKWGFGPGYTADQLRADRLAVAQAVREACAAVPLQWYDQLRVTSVMSLPGIASAMSDAIRAIQIEVNDADR